MTNSVIIRRCSSVPEALICVGLLKSRGFLAEVDNAAHAELDWGSIPALGGVAIRLPKSQYHTAKAEIVHTVENAELVLTELFEYGPDFQVNTTRRRWRAWSMLLVYFGIINLVGGFLLSRVILMIPKEWFPEPPINTNYYEIAISSYHAPSHSIGDGLLLMTMIGFYLLLEAISIKHATKSKETEP